MKTPLLACLLFLITNATLAQTKVLFYTTEGQFTVELREDKMPITAGNFIKLVDSGFYDGLIFHRVIKGFVIQGGDPTGTGFGGPGYSIQDEYHTSLNHDSAGVIAMAKAGPNTAGSQFYFTLSAQKHLDGDYAVFGTCIKGLDKIMAIGDVKTGSQNKPLASVKMDSLRVVDTSITVGTQYPSSQVKAEVYPNPFSQSFQVNYELKQKEQVVVNLYNAQGQLLEKLETGIKQKGVHGVSSIDHSLERLTNGLYYLEIATTSGASRMKLLKL